MRGVLTGHPTLSSRGPTVSPVDASNDIAEFLTTRRARIAPEQAGLPNYGKRRVPGLRREEVASLAGMSVEYYKRLERGNVSGVSELVLEALARALQLDDAERAHLFDLARAANPIAVTRSRPIKQRIRPVVQQILDQIAAPALVRNARFDHVGANALGRTLYAPMFDSREQPANSARFTFLDQVAVDFYPDWERVATVAHLRSKAGANAYDRQLSDLLGELSTRSVRFHSTGTKRIQHPVVGDLELSYESMELSADDGLTVAVFTAQPGSASQQALNLLASWAATPSTADDVDTRRQITPDHT